MATSLPSLSILDRASASKELDLASELFHRINRVIPQSQTLLVIPPGQKVRDAVALMRQHGYSQIPVIQNGKVLGVFSYRSFAQGAASATLDEWTRQKISPGDLRVDEFLERFEFARVMEEMSRVFDAMDRDNGVLIGTPERLIAILTPMDFLRYLHRVASPFVMVSEIELGLRALIRVALTPEQIATISRKALAAAYGGEDKAPTKLEEMTFDNYRSIVAHSDAWRDLETVFGGTRTRASGKLKEVGGIRNDLFHFKREITLQDQQTLALHRDWLLAKINQADSNGRAGVRQ